MYTVQAGDIHPPSNLSFPVPGRNTCNGSCTKKIGSCWRETSQRNRETCRETYHESRGTSNRLSSLLFKYPAHLHIKKSQLIRGRWLPPDVIYQAAKQQGKKAVVVAVGMGAGKTEHFKHLLKKRFNDTGAIFSHRVALVKTTAERLEVENYERIKGNRTGGASSTSYASTIHSQHKLVDLEQVQPALAGGLIGLDESESIAHEFNNTTIKNESKTLEALRQTVAGAGLLVMMDAHAGAGTCALLDTLGIAPADVLIVTADVQELAGYTVEFYAEKAAKIAMMGRIIADLKEGKRVIVTSLSAELLNEIEKLALERVPGLEYIKVTSDTSKGEAAQALNEKTYGRYQLILLSPSMSTGVSFDIDNADIAYVFAINEAGTGSPYDALQAMLRDRAVKSKKIRVCYQDSQRPLETESESALYWTTKQKQWADFLDTLPPEYQERAAVHRPDISNTIEFLGRVGADFAASKLDFRRIMETELKAKGAALKYPALSVLDNDELTPAERKEAKEQLREELRAAVVEAPRMAPADAELMKNNRANNQEKGEAAERLGLDTPGKVRGAVDRHYVESETLCNLDDMPEEEARALVVAALEDFRLVRKIREWEMAAAEPADLKRIQKAAMIGIQADDNDEPGFMEKLTTDKVNYPDRGHYGRILLEACGVSFGSPALSAPADDVPLNEATIKQGGAALFRVLNNSKSVKRFIECGLLPLKTIPLNVKLNKLEHIRQALEHYGLTLRKVRGSEEYRVSAESLARFCDLVNRRGAAGKNSVAERIARFDEYLDNAPVRAERAARRFADFVTTCNEAATSSNGSPTSSTDAYSFEDGAALIRKLWAEVGRSDDAGGFLAEFAGDMPDIEAGFFTVETLRNVVKMWEKTPHRSP